MRRPYQPHQKIDHYEILCRLPDSQGYQRYLAQDWQRYQQVMLTFPNDAQVGGKAVFKRFQQSAQLYSALRHPAFQQMFAQCIRGQDPYLVLEAPEGMTLRAWMQQVDRLQVPTSEIVRIITGIGEALAVLHQQGRVHRDLKPEHVVITRTGALKLIGLGLAEEFGTKRRRWGQIGFPAGTSDYLAPELWWGHPGSIQSDIYALGVILYELFSGHPPFSMLTSDTLLVPQLAFDPPDIRKFRLDVSPQLATVVMRTIRLNPSKRYASMQELLSDLACLDQQVTSPDYTPDPPLLFGRYHLVLFVLFLTLVVLFGLVALGLLTQLLHTSML